MMMTMKIQKMMTLLLVVVCESANRLLLLALLN